ncbi:hypothetical protein FB567DRAFT_198471 [Paraphoma chrysanthemicola]|uniref:Peptidase S8/S53 domain-containing protein n=1 Tax=Paraphoma chrysanthemicola TaxID=798071 RepID=A0A8K0QVZ3_9PLEO|nr:hypothetical protein FB567DRAFT_198471 [Paraphoma chrysanthemicola]
MDNVNNDVEVPKLFDTLLEILPRLLKPFMAHRRYVKQARVLGALSADLLIIEGDEDELSPEVMTELELICTWPKRSVNTTQCRTPTLRALAVPASTEEFLAVSKAVSTSLCAFASATPKQREQCKRFARTGEDAFVPPTTSNSRVPRPAKLSLTPDDYPNFVNMTLYETMRRYARCHCETAGNTTAVEHEAKLCLWNRPHVDRGLVDFDMHFWSHSYGNLSKGDCHWQQLRLHVPSKRKLKSVLFREPQASSVRPAGMSISHPLPEGSLELSSRADDTLSNGEFCALLSNCIGPAKIRLKVSESSLLRLHETAQTDQDLISKPSVSLAQVLQQHRLSMKMKIGLAFTLARSVWQYYHSDWMGSGWTCKTIHFMLEHSMDSMHSCVHASKPCFTVLFHSATQNLPVRYGLPDVNHKHPRVLALGMLLIDIARTSYKDSVSTTGQTQQQKANTDHYRGRYICERDPSWPDLGTADVARLRLRAVYKAATQSCFDMNIFKDVTSSTSPKDKSLEAEEHRKILYERVVWPLEDIIDEMGWTHSLGHIDAIKFDEAVMPESTLHEDSSSAPSKLERARSPAMKRARGESSLLQQPDNPEHHKVALFDDEMPTDGHTQQQRKAYSEWKAKFNRVYEHFIPDQPPSSAPPVKIAILDTGIDMDNDCIEVHQDRISGHNWLKDPKSKRLNDLHGHGTHIAGLILDLIPHSELYIAKVTDGEDANPETLARAMDYAIEQDCDIISISIGFSQKVKRYEEFELAIERAVSARVLIFAAASNGGANNDRAYPARERDVFCIHSTDAKGTRSKFSPTAENFVYNFATIGEAVESFWPTQQCTDDEQAIRVKSGTSFATPIAASIAAFLLLYARVHLPEQATRLKRYAAMESLLHELSKGSRSKKDRDDYQYLFLSRHPDTFFGRNVEEINNSFRKCT